MSIFLQDDTGGTFITQIKADLHQLAPGDVITVEGVTHVGLFMAGVKEARARKTGRAELPLAVPVSYDDLLSGRYHYERVEVAGIVRSTRWQQSRRCPILTLAMGTRKLDVEIVVPGFTNLPQLVDAKVRIQALAGGYMNLRRQLISPELLVSRVEDLRVETPPLSNPFDGPFIPAAAILNFNPAGESGHRVRVRGIVTYHNAGETLFLRDGEDGLLVRAATMGSPPGTGHAAQPGDLVEVAGFPAMGHFSACLEDASFRVIGRKSAPLPVPSSIAEVMLGTNDANLVALEGKLLDIVGSARETTLVVGDGATIFRARLSGKPPQLRSGSKVRLSGVCLIKESTIDARRFRTDPNEMEMLLRSAEDIAIVSKPSGWTPQRFATVIGMLLAVALVAGVWVVLLRRRVAEQSEVIRGKIQREAALEERHRMAREMHDTLAQSFSGLGFQLEALKARLPADAEPARTQLEVAREMVRYGQEDFRRSLMNLRAQELDRGGLAQALPELARQITAGTGIEVRCTMDCDRSLPEAVETNLLRISQECLTNSLRHAHANHIDLELRREQKAVRLRIADDGVGFDAAGPTDAGNGHFGWRGIRERAEQIHGRVEINSQRGRGTEVVIVVPT